MTNNLPQLTLTSPVAINKRLGVPPRQRGCTTGEFCDDVFLLSDGNVAVIGTDYTARLDRLLPLDAARAPYEKIVVIDRAVFIAAAADIG